MGNKKTVALVYDISNNPLFTDDVGYSDRSCQEFITPAEANRIARAITNSGYELIVVDGPKDLVARSSELRERRALVFNKYSGQSGLEREIDVPALCKVFGLRLIGASSYALTLARNKFHANSVLRAMGVATPDAVLLLHDTDISLLDNICYPAVVKPNEESNHICIDEHAIVSNRETALARISVIQNSVKGPSVIEEYIGGPEWHVAVIGTGLDAMAIGCVESYCDGKPITGTLKTRDANLERRIAYQNAGSGVAQDEACAIATLVHKNFGFLDYSRCDFRLSDEGKPVCMEVTPLPDLREDSCFMQAASQLIPRYDDVIGTILNLADKRG